MAKVIQTYLFHKGSSVTTDINGKRVRYIFTEEKEFNSLDEINRFVIKNVKPYTCASCLHDSKDGYCNYSGRDVTIEDIHDRSEGRICSKFKKI